ncbi:MAG: 2-hydroxyacyl-CoA dehydratase [Planctomycetes bacterium]|nr:2-hydroxyacyl-CoA dehydratase [Planctomycetota bacterium]
MISPFPPQCIGVADWDLLRERLLGLGLVEPWYGGPLGRHVEQGDSRLLRLSFDNSPAALRLWNFLLSEEERLFAARAQGYRIVGTMKDLGIVPLLAYALPKALAFYPDGAWWIPCVMELSAGLLRFADEIGLDESFCPVRAMVGAFLGEGHFPRPDLVTCSVGATCDDFSAIAQRLNGFGVPILWWEMPHVRAPDPGEEEARLPSGQTVPAALVRQVEAEFARIARHVEEVCGEALTGERLAAAIERANGIRAQLEELRSAVFFAPRAPLPALEVLIAEMLAIHYCSDRDETEAVLADLLAETRRRVASGLGYGDGFEVRVFWVNPVADLTAMNLLESCGGRLCGTDFMFCHALDPIPVDRPPLTALALMALSDPLAGTAAERARRVAAGARRFRAEAVLVSRIPGASHCAYEGEFIAERLRSDLGIPVAEIEVPPLSDSVRPILRTRIEAVLEAARKRRSGR